MGMYESWSYSSYEISKEVYDYLLPVYGICAKDNGFSCKATMYVRNGHYFFCGSSFDYAEMLRRIVYL